MALTVSGLEELTPVMIHETEAGGTDSAAAAEATQDVRGGACTLYGVLVANAWTVAAYVKIYDAAAVTVGTTVPDMIFVIPASTTAYMPINGVAGQPMLTGLSMVAVTAAGTAGTAPDDAACAVTLFSS